MILTSVATLLGLTFPQVNAINKHEPTTTQQEVQYQEIKTADLPQAITDKIAEEYNSYTVEKAFKGSDGNFKVNIEKTGSKLTLYFDKGGKQTKIERPEDQM